MRAAIPDTLLFQSEQNSLNAADHAPYIGFRDASIEQLREECAVSLNRQTAGFPTKVCTDDGVFAPLARIPHR